MVSGDVRVGYVSEWRCVRVRVGYVRVSVGCVISIYSNHFTRSSLFFFSFRDLGYVARDLSTKKHKCHVFRCDMPARAVARALLESHQREKKARTSQLYDQNSMEKPLSSTRPKDSRG